MAPNSLRLAWSPSGNRTHHHHQPVARHSKPRRISPAVLVVIGETLVGERDHAVQGSRAARMPQGLDANVLMVAGVVGFIQAVTATELGADCIPQELHDLDPLLVGDPV